MGKAPAVAWDQSESTQDIRKNSRSQTHYHSSTRASPGRKSLHGPRQTLDWPETLADLPSQDTHLIQSISVRILKATQPILLGHPPCLESLTLTPPCPGGILKGATDFPKILVVNHPLSGLWTAIILSLEFRAVSGTEWAQKVHIQWIILLWNEHKQLCYLACHQQVAQHSTSFYQTMLVHSYVSDAW